MPSHTLVAYVESAARGIKLPVAWFTNCIEVFVILLCTNINGLMSSSIVAMMPTEESKVDQGQAISIIDTYSLCPEISVVLAFKFCPTKSVILGALNNPSPDPAQCGKPTALGTPKECYFSL